MRDEVESIKALMHKMFDKHKDAQSTSLNDIQQEVKSLKSLLTRRVMPADTSLPFATASSSLPSIQQSQPQSQSQPQPQSQTPSIPQLQQPQLPFSSFPHLDPSSSSSSYSANRLGPRPSGSPSSSFASIANRPPGIPAWQMQSPSTPSVEPQIEPQKEGEAADAAEIPA